MVSSKGTQGNSSKGKDSSLAAGMPAAAQAAPRKVESHYTPWQASTGLEPGS
jgi:hypothetical protein